MAGGIDSKYLKDLEQVLEAEAALARDGVDLLADPEYRALRELFIDGDMPLEEFIGRVEGLADIRPEEGEASGADDGGEAGVGERGEEGALPDEDDDLADLDDLEDLRMLKDFREPEAPDDDGPGGSA